MWIPHYVPNAILAFMTDFHPITVDGSDVNGFSFVQYSIFNYKLFGNEHIFI